MFPSINMLTSNTIPNSAVNYDYTSNSYFQGPFNHVRDYNKLQGMTHPSDIHIQTSRDINHRYITVENSGRRPIGVAIRTYPAKYCNGLPSGEVTVRRPNGCGLEEFDDQTSRVPETCGQGSCTDTSFTPSIDFILQAGEIKHLAINTVGEPTQYLYILNPCTGEVVGSMTALRRDVNQFVLRDGLNGWFTQFYHRVGYKG
jgi:hypothetical protein